MAVCDVVAQHGRDGHRGDVPRQPGRRHRPAGRVRQDDSGAADGGGLREPARGGGTGRTDAERHVPWGRPGLRHRRLEAVRGGPRRHALAVGLPAVGVLDDPQPRSLQHDGNRLDHGGDGRGARDDDPRRRRDARGRQSAARGRPRHRGTGRRHGPGRTAAERCPHPWVVPERHRRPGGRRRVDERRHPSAGDRRAAGHRPQSGRLR